MKENDYEKMIQMYFNKRQIDMSDVSDRNAFKKFCDIIFVEEKDEFVLPNAGERKIDVAEKSKFIFNLDVSPVQNERQMILN